MKIKPYISIACISFVLIAFLISRYFCLVIRVSGTSMEPTLKDGSLVLVQRTDDIQRGDIVLVQYPGNNYIIKRAVGIGGDQIQITSCQLYVNDLVVDSTINYDDKNYYIETIVPENTVYLLGDNRKESTDSREYGCIATEYIIGIVRGSLWG